MVLFTGYGFVDWLTGSLDIKLWGYERHRVRFINVVLYLINGSGYKKPGPVAQKHKLIPGLIRPLFPVGPVGNFG